MGLWGEGLAWRCEGRSRCVLTERGWLARWRTQSDALGWYTVSRWDTGCGAVLKRNRVCLFGDASLVDDWTPPFEALVGVAEFFRLWSLVLDDEFHEGILRMVYFREED